MKKNNIFKTCPCCEFTWTSREEFLADPNLDLNGYQVNFKRLEGGMFLFTHNVEACRSTMTIMMEAFRDLYSGETYTENKANSEECPRYCLDERQLSRCDALCECAFAREILQIVQELLNEAKAAHQSPGKPLQSKSV
ncbi:MAG: hypothetical protein V2I50_02785 [Desulfuromusa sp.]|jgi:hypothetical protein|nr:hypothetical protein [Desulfuromusa sp.]